MTLVKSGVLKVTGPVRILPREGGGVRIYPIKGEYVLASHDKATEGKTKKWKSPLEVTCAFDVLIPMPTTKPKTDSEKLMDMFREGFS